MLATKTSVKIANKICKYETILGHIFFSPVSVSAEREVIQGMGLAPMVVLPERQRQGIGSMLVEAGIEIVYKRKYPFVIVLGHSEYYQRFGFTPASCSGLLCQWDAVSDEAFMLLVLDEARHDRRFWNYQIPRRV
ncbi:MAG: N-acetyltransferase [Thermodesulfobacteriota bacterium]|nr:N-acetyltransferase [Thermodesulfobacteriota bacterium]